jgi:hypothetical protein
MMLRSRRCLCAQSSRSSPRSSKVQPVSNSVSSKTTEQQLAEALATIKEKELEIADLRSKLNKEENVILGYFS